MKLTPEEETLIKALREIDRQNPLGIDNYSEAAYISICMTIISRVPAEAGRRYRLFLKQCKEGQLIDLWEAQRSKNRYEDLRGRQEDKAYYEKHYKEKGQPAPIWKTGAP